MASSTALMHSHILSTSFLLFSTIAALPSAELPAPHQLFARQTVAPYPINVCNTFGAISCPKGGCCIGGGCCAGGCCPITAGCVNSGSSDEACCPFGASCWPEETSAVNHLVKFRRLFKTPNKTLKTPTRQAGPAFLKPSVYCAGAEDTWWCPPENVCDYFLKSCISFSGGGDGAGNPDVGNYRGSSTTTAGAEATENSSSNSDSGSDGIGLLPGSGNVIGVNLALRLVEAKSLLGIAFAIGVVVFHWT